MLKLGDLTKTKHFFFFKNKPNTLRNEWKPNLMSSFYYWGNSAADSLNSLKQFKSRHEFENAH